jgi:small nuclear ribonucleoprotein (snRNP)-like protein
VRKLSCRKSKHSCGKDCLCSLLREFRENTIIITTKSGDTIEGKLKKVTSDCCVKILERIVMSPFIEKQLTVVRCKSIESFSIKIVDD